MAIGVLKECFFVRISEIFSEGGTSTICGWALVILYNWKKQIKKAVSRSIDFFSLTNTQGIFYGKWLWLREMLSYGLTLSTELWLQLGSWRSSSYMFLEMEKSYLFLFKLNMWSNTCIKCLILRILLINCYLVWIKYFLNVINILNIKW